MSLLGVHIILEMCVLRKDQVPIKLFCLLYNSRDDRLRVLAAETSVHKILLHIHNDQNLL